MDDTIVNLDEDHNMVDATVNQDEEGNDDDNVLKNSDDDYDDVASLDDESITLPNEMLNQKKRNHIIRRQM
jgi:hypothetical protein